MLKNSTSLQPIDDLLSQIDKEKESLFTLLKKIASIPSSTGLEQNKIQYLAKELGKMGFNDVSIDKVGNCVVKVNHQSSKKTKTILLVAHADTTCKTEKIFLKEDKDYIYGHGICDNSAGIVGLLTTLQMIKKLSIDSPYNIIAAFTVGEEGIGGKKGMKELIKKYGKSITAVVNMESHNIGRVTYKTIGQYRANISVEVKEGGHSYRNFGRPNAIVILSNIISDFSCWKLPDSKGKTTFNVGKISGGEGINIISQQVSMLFEIRSENKASLQKAINKIQSIINRHKNKDVDINTTVITQTDPASFPVNHKIYQLTVNAQKALNIKPVFNEGNTDADISMAVDIPSVTIGLSNGWNTHSLAEYVEKKSFPLGIKQAFLVTYNIVSQYAS